MCLQLEVQIIQHTTGPDAHPALGRIDLQDLVEVFLAIKDDPRPDTLPRLRGPAAPSRQRHAKPRAGFDRADNVRFRLRQHYPAWDDLIHAGVCGVQSPAEPIETDFSLDGLR